MNEPKDEVTVGPDCRDGKHAACVGDAWDEDADTPTTCECPCHWDTLNETET